MKINIPPLALCLLCFMLMYLVSLYTWSFIGANNIRLVVAGLLLVISLIFVVLGVNLFRQNNTTVNPVRPENTSTLVSSGIYAVSRNPMYVGFALSLFAWFIFLGNIASLCFVVGFIAYMNYVQIPKEERALILAFAEDYEAYKMKVPRWL